MESESLQQINKRIVSLDLLKIVSMLMIISLHYFNYSGVRESVSLNNWNYYFVWFFDILSIIAVNCYILCSGYLMVENHFKIRKLISLWIQVVFTNIICFAIYVAINGTSGLSFSDLLSIVFSISTNEYWYVSSYFAFYIISPLLIYIVKTLSVAQLEKITFVSILMFSIIPTDWTQIHYGFSFIWFVVLFFIAAYIRESKKYDRFSAKYLFKYFILSIITMVLRIVFDIFGNKLGFDSFGGHFTNYTFVTVLLASVMFFCFFKNINISGRVISSIILILSSTTFGIYLIHTNPLMSTILWSKIIDVNAYISKPIVVFHFFATIIIIFIVCAAIDIVRQLLFKLIRAENISNAIEKLITKSLIIIKDKLL